MPIVEVCPDRQVGGALFGCFVSARVGPFSEGCLTEAPGLAVRAGCVGFGADIAEAELSADGAEGAGAIASAVIRHDTPRLYAHRAIPGHRCLQVRDSARRVLVGVDLGEGDAGVVGDAGMNALPTEPVRSRLTPRRAVAGAAEAPELFCVQMDQAARLRILIAARGRRRVEIAETAQPRLAQDPADRRGRAPDLRRDMRPGEAFAPESDNARAHGVGVRPRREWGRQERSLRPLRPPAPSLRKRRHHLAAVLGLTPHEAAADAQLAPLSIRRTRRSRPRGVSRAS